ncbi:hypothetical protein ABZV14_09610 [Streptosporangium canum]|uniref:hypothetical protein n=1 Tax=Streptosporangium canum TaxID=324952 RepID=UPI0033A39385
MKNSTAITFFKKPGVILLLVFLAVLAALLMTVHINKPHSYWVSYVTPSPDGRTLTAKLMFSGRKADGAFCEQVRGVVVHESTSQISVDIQVFNTCAPFVSWGRITTTDIGYPFDIDLRLRTPLAGQAVVDKESGQPINIVPPIR